MRKRQCRLLGNRTAIRKLHLLRQIPNGYIFGHIYRSCPTVVEAPLCFEHSRLAGTVFTDQCYTVFFINDIRYLIEQCKPPNSTVRPSIEIIIVVFLNFACFHNRHSQNTAKVHIFTRRAYIRFRIKKIREEPYQFYAKLQKTSGEKLPHSAIPHTIPCTPSVRQSCSAISSCVANPYFKDTLPII